MAVQEINFSRGSLLMCPRTCGEWWNPSELKIWCIESSITKGRLVCFADIPSDALNLAGRWDAKVLDGLRGKATVGFTLNPWKKESFQGSDEFLFFFRNGEAIYHYLSKQKFFIDSSAICPSHCRPLSSTACWSLNALHWWVARWRSSGFSDAWRSWVCWRWRTGLCWGGSHGEKEGNRWPKMAWRWIWRCFHHLFFENQMLLVMFSFSCHTLSLVVYIPIMFLKFTKSSSRSWNIGFWSI